MAQLKIYRGAKSSIPSAKEDGALYVTSDTQELFLDIDSSTRIRISNIIEVADMTALGNIIAPISTMFYYVASKNQFYRYISNAWKCLGSTLTGMIVGSSASDTQDTASTGSVYINLIVDGTVVSSHTVTGSGSTAVSCNASGNITIYSAGGGGGGTGKTVYNDNEPDVSLEGLATGDVWINKSLSTS